MITIRTETAAPFCTSAAIYLQTDGTVVLSALDRNHQIQQYTATINLGDWDTILWKKLETKVIDEEIISIIGASSDPFKQAFIVAKKEQCMKIIPIPGDDAPYSLRTPHRIYHAYDTKRTYINIAESWQLFATLHHDELIGSGKLTHAELEAQLEAVQGAIAEIQATLAELVVQYPVEEAKSSEQLY